MMTGARGTDPDADIKAREYNRKWRESHPGYMAAKNKRWRENNPGKTGKPGRKIKAYCDLEKWRRRLQCRGKKIPPEAYWLTRDESKDHEIPFRDIIEGRRPDRPTQTQERRRADQRLVYQTYIAAGLRRRVCPDGKVRWVVPDEV